MDSLSLAGTWTVRQIADKPVGAAATVPGDVFSDLLAAKKIPDPFYRDNELSLRWVSESGWIYARDFAVPPALLARERVLLRCEGLDTFATVRVNGKKVGTADNQFRTWEFDVKAALKPGKNAIEVEFASVLPYMAKKQKERALSASIGAKHEPAGRPYVRKSPCNFGWDWGPSLTTCGICRDLRLVAFDVARFADIHIRQTHTKPGAAVVLSAAVKVEAASAALKNGVKPPALKARLTAALDGKAVASAEADLPASAWVAAGAGPDAGGVAAELRVRIAKPQLWWPNGMGEQRLYDVAVELLDADGSVLDIDLKRVGLRTLRLVREPDAWGESFRFEANGVPFFAKGANWIPNHALPGRIDYDNLRDRLQSAADVHMNMLRVWGGGLYESEAFYDLCDELGLCVWQDFMFACAGYPTWDAAFMDNCRAEFSDNIRRLRHRAALALWCGNNEMEQFCVEDDGPSWKNTWAEYKPLFDELLPEVLGRLDPDRDYWPSSEHTPGPDRKNSNNPDRGDGHLWRVWFGRKPFEDFRECMHRFCSEFGFQSFAEPAAIKGFTEPRDRNMTSPVMDHRQRSPIGNSAIMDYMLSWFRMPVGFENMVWLSQLQHGLAMKYAVEHWRRNMPRCMGALYWQLNDCWPTVSWASLDNAGRWKALQYLAADFFNPYLVTGVEDAGKGTVEIHVTADAPHGLPARVEWVVTDLAGKTLAEGAKTFRAPRNGSARVATVNVASAVPGVKLNEVLVWLELRVDDEAVSENLVHFVRPKQLELPDPKIHVAVRDLHDGTWDVILTPRAPALWAWCELDGVAARWSNNFVSIPVGGFAAIRCAPEGKFTKKAFLEKLRVRSLFDTYQE